MPGRRIFRVFSFILEGAAFRLWLKRWKKRPKKTTGKGNFLTDSVFFNSLCIALLGTQSTVHPLFHCFSSNRGSSIWSISTWTPSCKYKPCVSPYEIRFYCLKSQMRMQGKSHSWFYWRPIILHLFTTLCIMTLQKINITSKERNWDWSGKNIHNAIM